MSSWRCLGCRTVYPPGVPACPPCEAKEAAVAKANAVTGSTHYVGDGDPLPSDLNEEVRLVGPGAPAVPEPEPVLTRAEVSALIDEKVSAAAAEVTPDPGPDPDSTLPASSPASSVLVENYASQSIRTLRELVRDRGLPVAGSKAELVARLEEDDRAVPA